MPGARRVADSPILACLTGAGAPARPSDSLDMWSSVYWLPPPAQRQTRPHAEAVSRNRRQQATFRKVLAAAMATLREKVMPT